MFQLSSRRRVWLSIAAVSTTVLLAYSARSQLGGGVPFGASFVDMPDTGFSPPDGGLAAGHRHLVAVAENRFRILTKEGTVEKDVSLDAFFSDTVFNEDVVLPTSNPGCGAVAGTFSPRALFDQASNRFFVLAGSGDHDPARSRYLLAVSRSPDPTDGFCCYDFNGSGYVDRSRFVAERTWADYLTLGVDDVAVFFGSNQMSGENFVRSRANWLEKTPLLACEAPDVLFGYADFRHDGAVAVDQAFSVQAAHSFGPTSFVDETASCSSDLDCGGGTCTFAVPVCQGSGDTCTENADCGTCPAPTCAHSNTPCDPSLPHDARCGTCPTRTCSASSGPNSGNPCASNDQCGTCGPRHCNGTMDECTSDAECGDCLKEPGTCFPLGTILGAPTCTDDAGCDEIQCLDPNPFDADPLRFCFWDSVPIPLGVCTSDADCRTCLLGVSGLCKGSTNHGEDC
jgi:hypothetical protein